MNTDKRQYIRSVLRHFLFVSLVFAMLGEAQAQTQQGKVLTLLYHTDLNGRWRSFRCQKNGKVDPDEEESLDMANLLAQVQGIRRRLQRQHQLAPLLLSPGNVIGPDRAARYMLHRGAKTSTAFLARQLKRLRYDVLGWSSFDLGAPIMHQKWLLGALQAQGQRVSLANLQSLENRHPLALLHDQSHHVAPSTFMIKRGPWKIGILHVSAPALVARAQGLRNNALRTLAPIALLKKRVALLRKTHRADVVVLLSELETSTSQGRFAQKIAAEVVGIDVIISNKLASEEHIQARTHYRHDGSSTYIVGTRPHAQQLGMLQLTLRRNGGKSQIINVQRRLLTPNVTRYHPSLRRSLKKWEALYCREWGKALGKGRLGDTEGMSSVQFRRYVLDLMRLRGRTELAFLPSTLFTDEGFPLNTSVSKNDIYRALPRDVGLARITLRGSALSALLDSISTPGPDSTPLAFIGTDNAKINGRSIESNFMYHLVTTVAVAKGMHKSLEKNSIRSVSLLRENNSTVVQLRRLVIEHFKHNTYRKQRGIKVALKDGSWSIQQEGRLQKLQHRPTWTFRSSLQTGFTALFVEPININVVYTENDELNGGFYEKYTIQGQAELSLKMETMYHLWVSKAALNYAVDTSIQWAKGPPPGPIDPRIYQETNDQLTFNTQYHWRMLKSFLPEDTKWDVASPFIEALVETEVTTSQRPDLDPKAFFATTGSTEIFHHFETRAKIGLSFEYDTTLTLRIGAVWRKEWALNLLQKDPKNIPLRVNLDSSFGFSADYEIDGWTFATIHRMPLSLKSRGEYIFTIVSGTDKKNLSLHDFRWTNEVKIGISRNLFLALGFRLILFRGIFKPLRNNPQKQFVQGPLAFRIDPQFSFGVRWGGRHQSL